MSEDTPVVRGLGAPDETRSLGVLGRVDTVALGDATAIRAVLQPGWRWSEHVRPSAGTDWCGATHTGYALAGRLAVRTAGGQEREVAPGDAYAIPPGHDAWVVGDEPFVAIELEWARATDASAAPAAVAPWTVRRVADMAPMHGGAVRRAGAELGLVSFGMQVLEFPAGFAGYPEHDHAEDGMEEAYVVLDGSAELVVDGERLPLAAGAMARVAPTARRDVVPGPEGVRLLAIGSTIGRPYVRPAPFRLPVDDGEGA